MLDDIGDKTRCATLAHCAPKDRVLNAVNSTQLPINSKLPPEKLIRLKGSRRAKIEAWLNRQWYGTHSPSLALRALVPLYQCLRWLDLMRARRKVIAASDAQLTPIIVVGNLTVGGSGKTPLVIWLVQQALAAGFKPGVISRGYGGSYQARDVALIIGRTTHADWRESGDEPQLIANRTGVPVAVCRDRMVAAQALTHECDILICDDGLQNVRLPRTVEILVIDGTRRFGNAHLLPAGPLREALPLDIGARYPLRVCTTDSNDFTCAKDSGEYAMRLLGGIAVNTKTQEQRALAAFANMPVFALAGIGNPERFYQSLRHHGIVVEPICVGDHGILMDAHWQALTAHRATPHALLLTEKDALKYPASENAWAVPVSADVSIELWLRCSAAIKKSG